MSRSRRSISPEDAERFRDALTARSPRQGTPERLLRAILRAGARLVGWHVEARWATLPAQANLPGSGCVLAVAPHRAWVEPFLLYLAWPADAARLVWLADGRTVSSSWWRRRLLPRLGVIPIEGSVPGLRQDLSIAESVLRAGSALVVFPEVGSPSSPDQLRRISPGFAVMAYAADAPVIPVVVGGTHRIVRGSTFTIDGLDAIPAQTPSEPALDSSGMDEARAVAAEVADRIEDRLADRNARAVSLSPRRERWTWLGQLFS